MKLRKANPRFSMFALSILSLFVLLLNACAAQGSSNPTTGSTITNGGTWVDDMYEEPDSLVANASSETFSVMMDQSIWSPLFTGDTDGHIQPALATRVPSVANGDVSKDLKTWTFHLKPNLKWSDGVALNADDVDYTWKLFLDPKFIAATTTGFNLITSADVSADKLSITFHLSQGYAPFVASWTDGGDAPMPKHIFSQYTADKLLTSKENLFPSVASGPFKMTESKLGSSYTVVKNPNYYRASEGLPHLDKVIYRIVTDQNTILKDIQTGAATSSWFIDVTKTAAYNRLPNYKVVYNHNASNYEALYFNFKNSILGTDLAVRQAIAKTIDTQSLIDTARRGYAVPLCIDHGQSLNPGFQKDAACPKLDPTAAGKLLDGDGWVMGNDNIRHKDGKALELRYATTSGNVWRADDQLLVQGQLKAIGIKVDLQTYPASTYFGTLLPGGDWDMAEYEETFTYDPDDASLFQCNQFPPAGQNFQQYCNHDLDKLFTQEQATNDPAGRQAIFNQEHAIYLTQFPFLVYYSPVDLAVVANGTQGYLPGPMGSTETVQIENWSCTNGKCPTQ